MDLKQKTGCILISWFVSILVFKSSAADPVHITAWEGFLSSPGYPATYPPNSSLIWIKSVSPGNRVKISISDLQTTCDTDYLEIKDGDSMASPLIARYCGNVRYTEITSSGTRVLIHFVSDGVTDADSQRGFQLQHTGDCQVHTNQTSGVITPPNYPNNYPNYMDCLWTIQLHPAMQITLECDEIALEYEEDCTFDFIEILAGPSPDSPVLGRYCGVLNYSLTFEREGNMSIRFESDPDKEFRGFRCVYNVFKDYSTTSILGSTLRGKHIMGVNPSSDIYSSPASYTRLSSQMTIDSSTESHQQHVTSIYNVQASPTGATPVCCASTSTLRSDDTVMFQTHRQSSYDSSKTTTDSLTRTTKGTTYTANSASRDQTRGLSTRDLSRTLQTDSLRPVKGTYGASIDETYGQTHGLSIRHLSQFPQTGSLRTVKPTYSAYIDQTHKQTHEQSTRSLSKFPQTDSHRTVRGTAGYGVSMIQGSFVGVDQSEKASNFQGQSRVSSFQVRPSFSSLSPAISPSHTAPSHPTDDAVTPPAFQFPWHLTPFLVIIFVIIVVLFTYYLRIPDIVDALILAIKDKRRQMNASKPKDQSLNLTKGNFSTEGFKTSLFHSYQREVFYEEGLNYSFFETEATKAIEFSVHLDDEGDQSSRSEESVEISCEMDEETPDRKQGHDTLSEMFDTSGTEILTKRNTDNNRRTHDTRRNRVTYFHDSPASCEI